jgi:hypothetical protein
MYTGSGEGTLMYTGAGEGIQMCTGAGEGFWEQELHILEICKKGL